MRALSHQNIIQLFDVMLDSKNCYLVMELAQGGDLWGRVSDDSGFDEETARYFFQQIVAGVSYCHQHSIVHHDLKLENLLLDAEDNIKICDFGLSVAITDSDQMCLTGGSRHYAAPEVFAAVYGNSYSGPPTDVWSCGIILYAMLFGTYPFQVTTSLNDVYEYKVLLSDGEYPYPEEMNRYSSALKSLMNRMLDPDPEKRISMSEIKMDPWLRGESFQKGAYSISDTAGMGSWEQSMSMNSMISVESAESVGTFLSDADYSLYRGAPEQTFDLTQSSTFKKQSDFDWAAEVDGVYLVDDFEEGPVSRGHNPNKKGLARSMTIMGVEEADGIVELDDFEDEQMRFSRFVCKNESVDTIMKAIRAAFASDEITAMCDDFVIEGEDEEALLYIESESTDLQIDVELFRLGPGEPLVDVMRGAGPPLLFNKIYEQFKIAMGDHFDDDYPRKKPQQGKSDNEGVSSSSSTSVKIESSTDDQPEIDDAEDIRIEDEGADAHQTHDNTSEVVDQSNIYSHGDEDEFVVHDDSEEGEVSIASARTLMAHRDSITQHLNSVSGTHDDDDEIIVEW
eukprot:TRINITY_DN1472_c0_g1_i6.p1 TRINITY_DN1472_c0_g1~~TRINITY_DN1472_c0_g1_i6.p1  ORF type:complete len:660 (-),score=250.51 TRINITY_DN1472_c0_g1_i6:729-2426(-)